MNDLVDRESVWEIILMPQKVSTTKQLEMLKKLPSAEPIIRCKDCKWCVEHYDTNGDPYWVCKNWDGGTDADGFCHEAEKR